ncbi:DUF7507 domain-containing protein [Flavobacterium faecale]|uniref:DUF7507 domain-containing protein n=1 Tax=Flavobacterium faecale TaxID=1355330 RepID=UPI003AAD1F82
MKTILLKQKLRQIILFSLLLLLCIITNSYSQESGTDGNYCPGPGAPGDEYGTGIVFSQTLNPSPSSTCQIGTIRAKVNTNTQVLKLGMNIGNSGAALFRLYLDTDQNPLTGLTSDVFGGPLTVAGAEYILEINSNANTFKLYSGNGSTKTQLTIGNGLEAHSGGAGGCNGSGETFLEFNIPFGSIGFDICSANSPGIITITKLASVSGNSDSSSRCINTPLTFGIPLKGSVGTDATVCSGINNTPLTVSGLTSGSTIVKWQSSVNPFSTWTDIANTSTTYNAINLTQTTKYRAVFSNAGLCSGSNIATSEATITVSPSPILTFTQTNILCKNDSTGSINITASSGVAPYTYAWIGTGVNSTAEDQTGLKAGTYKVTVTDSNNCSSQELVITLTEPAAALSSSITTQTNVDCFGNSTGSVTVAGANGTAPYTYAKDGTTFGTSGTFTGLTMGAYTITVKDANGCTTTQAVNISQPAAALSSSITAQTNVDCFGNSTGSVTVAGANGTAPYTYAKDGTTFGTSGTFTGLAVGAYTITVKDAKGCTTTQAVNISQPAAALSSSITAQTNVDCFGNSTGSVTVAGANGTAPYTYAKDGTTFGTSGTFTGLAMGAYTITVKDANGCTTTQAVNISQPAAALSSSITAQTNVDCFGNSTGSVTVAGANGTAPYTYAKDGTTFGTSGTFTGLAVGAYTITVKDAKGCTTTQAVNISQPAAALSSSITAQTNVDCFGNSTGSVTVAGANGTAPYTYAKDGTTFGTSGTFTGLAMGAYTITVKDAKGCTTTQAVNISQPVAALSSSITAQTNVDCFGNSTGSVTVAGANGTAQYTYAKDGTTFGTSGTFTGLAMGAYTITVKDANGCTTTQAVNISQPAAALYSSITAQTNVDCFGNSTGSVTVAGANGTAPYTYAKDGTTFGTSGTFTGLAVGAYTITVKDAKGCTTTQAVNISQPAAALSSSITAQTNVDCFGNSTGSVTVAGANGTAPYTYAKDGTTFGTSGTFTGLAMGAYTITVKDAKGCTTTQAVNISQPAAALSSSITAQTNIDCFGNSTGSVTVAGANGTAPYTYAKDGTTFGTSGTFTGLAMGAYTITVKDAKGCTTTQAVNISQPAAALSSSITAQTNVDCFGNSTGSVTVAGANGTAPYTYAKDGTTFGTSGTFTGLAMGAYTITVKDANGCTTTQAVNISQPAAALSSSITAQTNVDCFGNSTGSVTVAGANGTAPYTYAKDGTTFGTSGTFTGLAMGAYTITVKDAKGCTTTQAVNISQPAAALSATATITNNNNCIGCANGSINQSVSGGTAPYSFTWSNNETTEDLANLSTGTYSVEIKDSNGCSINKTYTITESGIALVKTGIFIDSNNDGIAQVGEVVNYSFAVTNTGNVTVTNVNISDILIGATNIIGNPIPSIAPGITNNTVTATYTLNQNDINLGKVINTATALGKDNENIDVNDISGTAIDNDTPTEVLLIQSPRISITKDGAYVDTNNDGKTNIGDHVSYVFVVKNTGNVTLTNVSVSDPNAIVTGGPIATLAVGATDSTTFTALHAITQEDIDAGIVYNLATVTSKDPNENPITATSTDPTPCTTCIKDPQCPDCTMTPLAQNPKIAIVKSNNIVIGENGCAIIATGDVVTYTFTVTNTGNVSLNNVAVVDLHPDLSAITLVSGDTNTNNILDVNETWTYTATYTIKQADIDAGKITNQASVSGFAPDQTKIEDLSGDTSDTNGDNVIPICTTPKIAIVKSNNIVIGENGCAIIATGDVVTYTFTVTNTGNVSLNNVAVVDLHPDLSAITLVNGDTNTNNILDVNETWTHTATYTVKQADIDAGKITNQASVSGFAPDQTKVEDLSGDTSDTNGDNVIPICTTPKIAIVKSNNIVIGENGCAIIATGDVVTYTFTVTNTGNVSLNNVAVADLHPDLSAITLVSGDTNTNNILDVNETWTYTATYTVKQADIDAGKITNQASVSGFAPDQTKVEDLSGDTSDTNGDNVIPICTTPKIAIVKSNNIVIGENGCAIIATGDVVTYTFTVTNTGNVSLNNVAVVDLHPDLSAITLVSGDTNTNNILDVNETWTYTATYTVKQADIDAGKITNQASVSGFAPDQTKVEDLSGDTSDTNGDNVIPICTTPKIAIVKSNNIVIGENGCAIIATGDVVTYTFTVTNTGNVSLNNVAVVDLHPDLSAITLVSGDTNTNNILDVNETWTYTATYTVKQADIDAGKITNQASVSGFAPDQTKVEDLSGDTSDTNGDNLITICTSASISISKDGTYIDTNNDGKTNIGDVVSYVFVVKNTGNVTLTNVTVTDNNAIVSGGSIPSLAVGATDTTTFTAVHTITQADIDAGIVYNWATANAKDPKENPVTATSTDPTPCTSCPPAPDCPDCTITELNQSPSISITKDGTYVDTNNDGKTNIGDVVSYVFVVKNTGNVTLTNVTVTDNNAIVSGGSIPSLAVGATDTTTFTAVHTITQADIDAGIIYNWATANAKDPKENPVTATSTDPTPCTSCPPAPDCPDCTITELNQSPSISITKDGTYVDTNNDGKTNIGDVVSYVFVVKNTGNVTLTNVTVTDNNAIVSGGSIPSLAVGATDTTTFTAVHTITQADIDAGIIYNLATANTKDPKENPVTATSTDPTPCTSCPPAPDCPDCTITLLNQDPVIVATLDGTFVDANNDGIANVGETITYTIVVTNTGNVTLDNVIVTDTYLPAVVISGNPITLEPGASNSTNFTGTYTITQADIDAGYVYNIIISTGTPPMGEAVTDTSSDPTPCTSCPVNPDCLDCTITALPQKADLVVVKIANTEFYSSVGDIINYTIQVQNTGNVSLLNISVTDPLTGLNETIPSLAPGTYQEYIVNYTIKQEDRVNLSVTNVAFANGFTPNQTPISASDSEVVEANIVLGCGTITVHNAFSPNGDGINELFIIENIEDILCYPTNTLEIYNRWGILVYETQGYDNVTRVFKGVSEGRTTVGQSSGLPAGTYYYILNYTSIDGLNNANNNTKDGYLYLAR